MVLPQKAIEQLSREPVRTPGWSFNILMISGTFLFLSLMVYLGLLFGYKPYYERQLTDIQRKIDVFSKRISAEDQDRIITFYSQLFHLHNLLQSQPTASRVFAWLEDTIHPNAVVKSFGFDVANRRLSVSGDVASYRDLVEQLVVLEALRDDPREGGVLKSIGFSGTSAGKGTQKEEKWPFDFALTFREGFFSGEGQGKQATSTAP